MDNSAKKTVREAALAERAAYTQNAVLDAAELIFAQGGLQGARVRDIANAAGVNVATLYNYYKNKTALYEAVLERGIQPVIEILKRFSESAHDAEASRQAIHDIMSHLAERPHVSRLIYLEAVTDGIYLKILADKWFRPFMQEIFATLSSEAEATVWDESVYPFLTTLFIQLSFGHFALAPLLREVLGSDPLSASGLANQTRFIEQLIKQIFPDADGTQKDSVFVSPQ
jgi:AcrR family transcriptional regulator